MKTECPICKKKNKINLINWNDYRVYKCMNCELSFCKKLKEKEIGGDSSPVDLNGIKMMAESFFKTSKKAKKYALTRLMIYEKFINRKCKSILEIGCGPGVFFEHYNNLNIKWVGEEINPYWIGFGKENKIPIIQNKTSNFSEKYDIINAHQVLEHVEDPNLFLSGIKKRLRKGGLIHFELPNQNSLTSILRKIHPKLSYDYGFIQPPMHMRSYSKKTLKILFENHDIKCEYITTCANNNSTWGQVRNYTTLQNLFYSSTGYINLGSLLIGIATKN